MLYVYLLSIAPNITLIWLITCSNISEVPQRDLTLHCTIPSEQWLIHIIQMRLLSLPPPSESYQ